MSAEQRELERHSFIVKIWLEEEADSESGHARWRGHITHVATQNKRYVESLAGITSFINEYLVAMGAGLTGPNQGEQR